MTDFLYDKEYACSDECAYEGTAYQMSKMYQTPPINLDELAARRYGVSTDPKTRTRVFRGFSESLALIAKSSELLIVPFNLLYLDPDVYLMRSEDNNDYTAVFPYGEEDKAAVIFHTIPESSSCIKADVPNLCSKDMLIIGLMMGGYELYAPFPWKEIDSEPDPLRDIRAFDPFCADWPGQIVNCPYNLISKLTGKPLPPQFQVIDKLICEAKIARDMENKKIEALSAEIRKQHQERESNLSLAVWAQDSSSKDISNYSNYNDYIADIQSVIDARKAQEETTLDEVQVLLQKPLEGEIP